jgi:SAM-dependent methyltransferase
MANAQRCSEVHVDDGIDHVRRELDELADRIDAATAGGLLPRLVQRLHELRRASTPAEWEAIAGEAKRHRLATILREDPFIRRSLDKPRGYAGDAVLIDYIYEGLRGAEAARTSLLGRAICAYTAGSSSSAVAVRERREWCAQWIDRAARQRPRGDARVLSVACGHLREMAASAAYRHGRLESIVALDHDPASLDEVRARTHPDVVRPELASVRSILRGEWIARDFDLIYSAGLYDYLPEIAARELTARLFAGLRPGGRLIVANFNRDFAGTEFMSVFMGWPLICRSGAQLVDVSHELTPELVASRRVFASSNHDVLYAELVRR